MANRKLTELTSTDATSSSDLMCFVDDPGGTPISKVRAISDLMADYTAADSDVFAGTSTALFVTPAGLGANWGSAFPASPETGQEFFRTDLGFRCYYDGTRWLTAEYASQAITRAGITNAEERGIIMPKSDYDIYVTQININTYVDTTNNSSDYWTFQLNGVALARAPESTFFSVNTSADAADTWVDHSGPATDASPTNQVYIFTDVSSNGTPGAFDYDVQVNYRYIIT